MPNKHFLHSWTQTPKWRRGGKLVLDFALAAGSWQISSLVNARPVPVYSAAIWGAACATLALLLSLHRQHYRGISFRDLGRMLSVFMGVLLLSLVARIAFAVRSDIALSAALLTVGSWVLLRLFIRATSEWRTFPLFPQGSIQRTLILGAGRAGVLVAQEIQRHRELHSTLVGFVDDALEKQGALIQGLPVLGPSNLLAELVQEHDVNQVILAMPSAPGSVIRALSTQLKGLKIGFKTVPGIFDLLGPKSWRPELRDVAIEDLLRRESVVLDLSGLRQTLADQVVLITGAGGSIGGEIARQVAAFGPSRLVLLGRGENSLWETERSLKWDFEGLPLTIELCDIRNPQRLGQVFERWKPSIVFHAAAHKHVPYLEQHPEEGVLNNVVGTQNVLEASILFGVRHFVNISTDKAVNPANVLGATKRIAECLVQCASDRAPEGSTYVSVRFGNVLGSRGSVVQIFREQLRRGEPITVTHKDMTRYFMTIPEASQLVLQAGLLGSTGQIYVLDMGEPVRIWDLATDMARLSSLEPGEDVEIQVTGIRPGEKLYEELFGQKEQISSSVHPKVFEAFPEPRDPAALHAKVGLMVEHLNASEKKRPRLLLEDLMGLVPTYAPSAIGLGKYLTEKTGPIQVILPKAL